MADKLLMVLATVCRSLDDKNRAWRPVMNFIREKALSPHKAAVKIRAFWLKCKTQRLFRQWKMIDLQIPKNFKFWNPIYEWVTGPLYRSDFRAPPGINLPMFWLWDKRMQWGQGEKSMVDAGGERGKSSMVDASVGTMLSHADRASRFNRAFSCRQMCILMPTELKDSTEHSHADRCALRV